MVSLLQAVLEAPRVTLCATSSHCTQKKDPGGKQRISHLGLELRDSRREVRVGLGDVLPQVPDSGVQLPRALVQRLAKKVRASCTRQSRPGQKAAHGCPHHAVDKRRRRSIYLRAKGEALSLLAAMAQRQRVNEVKVVLLGDMGVGKSSIALRLVHDQFNANSVTTVG